MHYNKKLNWKHILIGIPQERDGTEFELASANQKARWLWRGNFGHQTTRPTSYSILAKVLKSPFFFVLEISTKKTSHHCAAPPQPQNNNDHFDGCSANRCKWSCLPYLNSQRQCSRDEPVRCDTFYAATWHENHNTRPNCSIMYHSDSETSRYQEEVCSAFP